MHTHRTPQKRHRWFVVLPIVVLMAGFTIREGFVHPHLTGDISMVPADGQIVVADGSSAQTIVLPNGILRAEPGTRFQMKDSMPVLQQGTVTIVTHALQKIEANGLTLEGWNGAYQVIIAGSGVTTVALTTPVLAMHMSASMIVPASMQWETDGDLPPLGTDSDAWMKARTLQRLPDVYLHQALQTADELSSLIKGIPASTASQSVPSFSLLQLPAAQARSASAGRSLELDAVAQDLAAGGGTALTTMLSAPDASDLLASDEGKSALPLLLSLAQAHDKADLLLPYVTDQSDLFILALYHPSIRDHVWVQQISSTLSDDDSLTLFTFVPFADNQTLAMSSIASARWLADFQALLLHRTDASDILDAILPKLTDQVQMFAEVQYPERADRYRSALITLAEPYTSKLSPYGQAALNALQSQNSDGTSAESSSAAVSSASTSSVSSQPTAALEAEAHAMLAANGFMFTPQTILHGNNDQTVDISNAVFGARNGDQIVSFTFDPAKDIVSNIEQNGSTLPYDLSLKQYIEWMKDEK